jgi:hypothetical protein
VSAKFRFVVAHVLLGAGFLFLTAQSQADNERTYLNWDEVKCSDAQSTDCYEEVYCHLYFKTKGPGSWESIQTCEDLRKQFGGYHSTLNDYSRYRLKMGKKPSTVVVSIHGLWGDAAQFTSALARCHRGIEAFG